MTPDPWNAVYMRMFRRHQGSVPSGLALLILALLAWGELGRIGGRGSEIWWANAG